MGIYDRSYIRNASPKQLSGRNMLWVLILVNVAMFFIFAVPGSPSWYKLSLTLNLNSAPFHVYQLVSSMFIHANFSHIFFNMFGLYIFGSLIAERFGFWRFLGLYLVSGLAGNLLFLLFYWSGNQPHLLMGASGAVYGVMAATAMLEPDRRFMIIFLPFTPIKTTTLVVVYTAVEIFSQLSGANTGIAHLAHLGGFAGGYLFTKFFMASAVRWLIRDLFKSKSFRTPFSNSFTPPPSRPAGINPDSTTTVTQAELDFLLDKISSVGVNGLSDAELARLRQAREQMNRDRQSR